MSYIDKKNLDARLLKARVLASGGHAEESIEELRNAVYDAASLPAEAGRARLDQILQCAKANDTLEEMEDILENEALLDRFYGREWK
jgi:hypothetical protein